MGSGIHAVMWKKREKAGACLVVARAEHVEDLEYTKVVNDPLVQYILWMKRTCFCNGSGFGLYQAG